MKAVFIATAEQLIAFPWMRAAARSVNIVTIFAIATVCFGASAPCAAQIAPKSFGTNLTCRIDLTALHFTDIPDAPTQITQIEPVRTARGLPAFCQAEGYVAQSVGIRIGLPQSWNGKFIEMGCGGYCGTLEYFGAHCEAALRRGYACIVSDMGHKGGDGHALWAYDSLSTKFDWGFRSAHVTALAGKALVERYYGSPPSKSYFVGHSTGGRQALQEAQHFPGEFDGIIAIAPPVDLAMVYLKFAWGRLSLHDSGDKPILGTPELKLLTDHAVAKCDMDDGLRDAIISDPLHCEFDPSELSCKPNQTSGCLTPVQIEAVRKTYAGPMNSSGERLTLGGPLPGSEAGQAAVDVSGWRSVYLGLNAELTPAYSDFDADGFRYLFFWPDAGPTWQLQDLDFTRDSERMRLMEALYDCTNPDLRPFRAAGGKLLIFQGLNDVSVPPREIIDYYQAVERVVGGRAEAMSFARLFVLPGVGHLGDGPGAATLDYLSALENWVEKNSAPDRLIAARLKDGATQETSSFPLDSVHVQFTRPVYPYPIMARYKGRGDPDDAASFAPMPR